MLKLGTSCLYKGVKQNKENLGDEGKWQNNYVSLFRRNEHKFISNKMQKQQKIVAWKQTSLQYRLEADTNLENKEVNVLLLGPQVRFMKGQFEQNYNQKGFL